MKTIKKLFMNRIIFVIVTLLSVGFAFASCNKDTSEEEILKNQLATADSLLKRGGVIKYAVKIVSTANSSILKSKMSIENASVTIYQNDKVYTAITDANGFAIFPDMRIGTAAVNVKLKDHAEVDYVADLTPAENLINLSQGQVVNTVRYASTMVPMFPIAAPGAATITGKVTAELDLTNTAPEPAPNVTVTAKVNVDDPDFVSRYITPTQGTTNSNAGRIIKFAFQDATISTQTDAQGNYTLQVPAALNGLPITLGVADYQTNQKLYLENDPADGSFKPGEYTVPVLFSSNLEASPIPVVKPVYISVDDPIIPIGAGYRAAKLSFNLDDKGSVTQVDVQDGGNYTNKPIIVIRENGKGAILEPTWNENTGGIESVTVVKGGQGYTTSSNIGVLLLSKKEKIQLDPVIDNYGIFNNIILTNPGYGYLMDYKPNISITSAIKDAKIPTIDLVINQYSYKVTLAYLKSNGSGFKNVLNYPSSKNNINLTKENTLSSLDTKYIKDIYLGTGKR